MAVYTTFQTRVLREMSDAAGDRITTTDVLAWTNDASRDIAVRSDMLHDEQYISSVVGQQSYTLPNYTLDAYAVSYDGVAMERMDPGPFFSWAVNATAKGTPLVYTFFDDALYVQPPPIVAGDEIRLFRSYAPADIASVSSTVSMPFSSKHDSLISKYVKARAYEKLEDFDAAAHYTTLYEQGMDSIAVERSRYEGARSPKEVY